MGSYQYKPLEKQHIRLLEVEPGTPESPLHGRLILHHIGEELEYNALSYFWGCATLDHEIYISLESQDAKQSYSSLRITSSLHSALKRIRHRHEKVVLWADAACINQNDLPELSEQVSIMRHIYSNAIKVLIYLGGEEEGSELIPEVIQQLQSLQIPRLESFILPGNQPEFDHLLPALNGARLTAFNSLFCRPWFTRLWVIQETVVAKDAIFLCGAWSEKLEVIEWALKLPFRHIRYGNPLSREAAREGKHALLGLLAARDEYQKATEISQRIPLMTLLSTTRSCHVTKPVDRLYGILGISSAADAPELQPDYTESMDQTLLRFYLYLLKNFSVYDLLRTAHISRWEPGQPTWIPSFTKRHSEAMWDYASDENPSDCDAGRCSFQPHAALLNRSDINQFYAEIKGVPFDKVSEVGKDHRTSAIFTNGISETESRNTVYKLIDEIHGMESAYYRTPQERIEAEWMTLIAGSNRARDYDCDVVYEMMQSRVPLPLQPENGCPEWSQYWMILAFVGAAIEAVGVLTTCQTRAGRLARVPYGTQPGDVIAVFPDMQVPLVLRERPEGQIGYLVVGICYVHGIMNGEVFQNIDSLEHEMIRDFVLT